jgi:hypothetical protein
MLRVMPDNPPGWIGAMFVLVPILVGCGFLFTVYAVIRNRNALKQAGFDPITAQVQLASRVMSSELLTPQKTLEQRLAELDDLHTRGVISDAEHTRARAQALASP